MTALVDGDILVYRCGFAAESRTYGLVHKKTGEPFGVFDSAAEYKEALVRYDHDIEDYDIMVATKAEPVENALSNVRNVLESITDQAGPITGLYLSKGNGFRHGIATMKEYKGHRKDAAKPIHYDAIRQYMVDYHGARIFSSVEADDVLALNQTEDTVIVSIDKDLLQVPGKHYNWVRHEKRLVTPEVGMRVLFMQNLTGDNTDNIPGIYRCGEETARKILAPIHTREEMCDEVALKWKEYLQGSLKKFIPMNWQDDETVEYSTWWGDTAVVDYRDIVDEVYKLVRIGGQDAITAAEREGEEVLLTGAA